jgi:hypothetical protein
MTDNKYYTRWSNDELILSAVEPEPGRARVELVLSGVLLDKIDESFKAVFGKTPHARDYEIAVLELGPQHLNHDRILEHLLGKQHKEDAEARKQSARANIEALEQKLAAVRSEYTEALHQNNACSVAITNLSNQINIIMHDVSTLKAGLK